MPGKPPPPKPLLGWMQNDSKQESHGIIAPRTFPTSSRVTHDRHARLVAEASAVKSLDTQTSAPQVFDTQDKAPARPHRTHGPRLYPRGLSAHHTCRHGRARLGRMRLCVRVRRRLRGPSEFWLRHHRAAARGPRLPRGRHRAARLARPRERNCPRQAEPRFSRLGRQHGLHGEPLQREQAPPAHGRLHPRRRGGAPARSRCGGVRQPHPPHLQGDAHRARRYRGVAPPPRPLRLLVGQAQALHPARRGRRPYHLRHGRARHRGGRRRARRRSAGRAAHLHRRHGLSHALARRGIRLHAAAQLGRASGR